MRKMMLYFLRAQKKSLKMACEKPKHHNNTKIASENILWAITKSPDSVTMKVLSNLGADVLEIKQGIISELEELNQEPVSEE